MSNFLAREHITEALRFWEVGRGYYNLILVVVSAITAILAGYQWSDWSWLTPWLLILGLFANLLYCAAYPVDLLVQASDLRALWRTLRYALWLMGTISASLLAVLALAGVHFI
ncbi:MAG: hypothetical protein AB7O98_15605 [Hyphomonadaceae bacterium]